MGGRATADELPPGFTVGLVAMAAAHNVDYPGEGGLALSFLFHGDALSDDVLVASIEAVIAGEHGYAADHDYAEEYGAAQWDTGWRHGAPALQLDFADEAFDDDFSCVPTDPMYALLSGGRAARAPPTAVFKDPDRAAYLFGCTTT